MSAPEPIEFKRVKSPVSGFYHEANGDFRKDVTKIRLAKNPDSRVWKLIIFRDGSPKGETYCECQSLSDAKETTRWHFAV